MDYPPVPLSHAAQGAHVPLRDGNVRGWLLSRWFGVLALVCLTAGMGLTVIDIDMAGADVIMLAMPNLEMKGVEVFGVFGGLALALTSIFVLGGFLKTSIRARRLFGLAAVALWLAALLLAAMEVNTAFEAVLATMAVLNRGGLVLDYTAQLLPAPGLWLMIIGIALLASASLGCRRT